MKRCSYAVIVFAQGFLLVIKNIYIYTDPHHLFQNPVEGVKKLSDFLGLHHDITLCERIVEESKFEAMRSREQAVVPDSPFLKRQDGIIRKGK